MGGFAYVVSMLLPYLGPAALALVSAAALGFTSRGRAKMPAGGEPGAVER
jgi:hypothetical protein